MDEARVHQELFGAKLTRRRAIALGGAALATGVVGRSAVYARSAADTLGYPALTVTIDEKTITVPEKIPAGLTFVTVKNTMPKDPEHMVWGLVPDDVTKDDIRQIISDETAYQKTAAATGTPPAGEEPVMPLLRRLTIVGGPDWAVAGKDAQGIVKFTEGTYVLMNVFGSQVAVFDVVVPGPDAITEEPKADVTVKLGNMVFVGLDQGVPAGKHLWKVANIDTQIHELAILPVKPGTTEQQVLDAFEQNPDAPFEPVGGNSILTAGQTAWQLLDLPPGSYVALCMAPMNWAGPPHAFMGMIKVFEAK